MRDDPFGTFVAIVLVAMTILLIVALTNVIADATAERDAYSQCVADIPGYLDAQEILYMEQECKQ